MLHFDFLEKGLEIVSPPHFEDCLRPQRSFTAHQNFVQPTGRK